VPPLGLQTLVCRVLRARRRTGEIDGGELATGASADQLGEGEGRVAGIGAGCERGLEKEEDALVERQIGVVNQAEIARTNTFTVCRAHDSDLPEALSSQPLTACLAA
jgi:hypothetical protein